jgi:hypothetical protein
MRRALRLLPVFMLAVLLTATAAPAGAKAHGQNGQIAFSRYDQATGEPRVFIASPDGTHEHQLLLPLAGDGPVWAPGGGKLLVTVFRPEVSVRPAIVNADGSGFRVLEVPQLPPDMDMGCRAWSPDATRLLCQATPRPARHALAARPCSPPGRDHMQPLAGREVAAVILSVNPQPQPGTTAAHLVDDASDVSCKDGTGQHPVDGPKPTHSRLVAGSRPASPTEQGAEPWAWVPAS